MKKGFYYFLMFLLPGCREIYEPPVNSLVTGYLVIEGNLNSGSGATNISLTRTTRLYQSNIVYERGARVQVEGEDNSVFTLAEKDKGIYAADQLNLNNGRKYRLRIKTADNQEYLSEFVEAKDTPPIDSISWKRENNGVQIYVNTHDPQNNTWYYQWQYQETWEYHAPLTPTLKWTSSLVIRGQSVVFIDPVSFQSDLTKVTCWQSNSASNLLLGSSAKLSKDVIYLPLVYIPPSSGKLGVLYSIHVKQYALSREAYEFLERMKKNTEQMGSVFDPQPSQLKGNIRCITNADEPVIGYVIICPVAEKRIFIRNTDVPGWNYSLGCFSKSIENKQEAIDSAVDLNMLPTTVDLQRPNGSIGWFSVAPDFCVDCTVIGTNKKPGFWP